MQQLLILSVVVGYFLLLLLVSHFVSRGADNSTFFVGNRKMPWPIVSIAMICAPISGVTFISVPGMVLSSGYTYLQMCLGFIVGYFVIATVLLPVFYKNRIFSIYSYLETRFCDSAYKSGAWMFLVSKILGTSVRFFVICAMLQFLVFEPMGVPFPATVVVTLMLVWLYTVKGGVKAVIWTDLLKCCVLIASVGFSIYILSDALYLRWTNIPELLANHSTTRILNFDDPMDGTYFWKQFLAGVFLVVAMTGLDQDMMQHALSCRDARSSMKNMILSSFMQFVVISLFLFLGTLMVVYAEQHDVAMPEKSDNLFGTIAFHEDLPIVFGVLFVLGLVSSTYSSIGSALTSLTTSFTVDILGGHKKYDSSELVKKRRLIHAAMATVMAAVIITFYYASQQSAINAVFMLASFTYGPILGLFMFGLFSSRRVVSPLIPAVCIGAPVLSWCLQWWLLQSFNYQTGFELLLINASITIIGLYVLSLRSESKMISDNA